MHVKERSSKSGKTISKKLPDLISKQVELESKIPIMEKKLALGYTLDDTEGVYILKKAGSNVVKDFIRAAKSPEFWNDDSFTIQDDAHVLWYLNSIGLGDNTYFQEWVDAVLTNQSIEGRILSSEFEHVGPLRVLVATRPDSENLYNAVQYWLANWQYYKSNLKNISVGVLALTELDCDFYSETIKEQINYLKSMQNNDGSWDLFSNHKTGGSNYDITTTSYALWAVSRVDGIADAQTKQALKWLKNQQLENGSWSNILFHAVPALLGLLAMGEGPKVPSELIDYKSMRLSQRLRKQKPVFVHTSPLYKSSLHVKEINDRIIRMFHNATKEIRITSPFIDMFYEEIINIKQQNPDIIIKIVTRPKKEVEGLRGKIAQNVIDLLNIATKGNILQSSMVHSRMVIIDDSEVLVSSSDLTRDQLYDEYNAGIWTSDKETVKKAIDFFENLFQLENKAQQS